MFTKSSTVQISLALTLLLSVPAVGAQDPGAAAAPSHATVQSSGVPDSSTPAGVIPALRGPLPAQNNSSNSTNPNANFPNNNTTAPNALPTSGLPFLPHPNAAPPSNLTPAPPGIDSSVLNSDMSVPKGMPSPVAGTGDDPNQYHLFSGDEQIVIKKPKLEALVEVNRRLNPYALDSDKSQNINLTDVLKTTIERNLDITLSQLDSRIGKVNLFGATGKFLPDINLGYNYQYLKGKAGIPLGSSGVGPLNFDTPFIIASAGFTYHVYRGGSILFGALQRSNQYKSAKYAQRTTISDALLNTTRLYYDLVLNEALLQIRIRAVEVSKAQLQVSQNLVQSGRGTNLDLFQSETQLSSDTQNLIDQQIARRIAAIKLSDFLNVDQSVDLIPIDTVIATKRLISDNITVPHLVGLAIANRPELKDRKEQALAAKKQIVIASAPLQPKLDFNGTAYGIGETLSKSTSTDYVYNPNGNGTILTEHGQRQLANLYSIGLNATWNFGALGTTDIANMQVAKLQTREAYLRLTRESNLVIDQARQAYLNSLSAARKLEEANKQVQSATEELRLSRLRFENGLSKNIDVLRAQQDYTSALIVKAQAIINYNIAQAQVVHDIGLTSVETLTRAMPEGT